LKTSPSSELLQSSKERTKGKNKIDLAFIPPCDQKTRQDEPGRKKDPFVIFSFE